MTSALNPITLQIYSGGHTTDGQSWTAGLYDTGPPQQG